MDIIWIYIFYYLNVIYNFGILDKSKYIINLNRNINKNQYSKKMINYYLNIFNYLKWFGKIIKKTNISLPL